MKTPTRLRLDRIAVRTKKQVREINAADAKGTAILAVAEKDQREIEARRKASGVPHGVSFLLMYNEHDVDFVRLEKDGTYTAVLGPKQATHALVATSDNRNNLKQKPKKRNPLPSWWALSVCAVPMKPRLKQTAVVVRKKFPKDAPAYSPASGVEGKRLVLVALCSAMRAKFKKSLIGKMNGEECDALYYGLKRAALLLKSRRLSEKEQRQQPKDILTS